jgi:hypothetical protein
VSIIVYTNNAYISYSMTYTHTHTHSADRQIKGKITSSCITITDTIILTSCTNNAYTYDTHTPLSADRQIKGKITSEGVFLEQLETDVGQYLPEVTDKDLGK